MMLQLIYMETCSMVLSASLPLRSIYPSCQSLNNDEETGGEAVVNFDATDKDREASPSEDAYSASDW